MKRVLSLVLAVALSSAFFACDKKEKNALKPVEGNIEQVVDGNLVYDVLKDRMAPKLAFNEGNNYKKWKKQVKEKFIELFGIDKIKQNACPLNVKIDETVEKAATEDTPAYTRYHILFDSEYGCTVPCYLLVPNTGAEKYPLAITLQGHAGLGYLYSIGEVVSDNPETIDYAKRGDFAVQAVQNGFAALAIEQRGMGQRYAESTPDGASMCEYAANQELIRGRTILGGRIWDVSKAIDALSDSVLANATAKVDLKDITITGSSGGGTASYYAACYDERITLSAPNCGFCTFEESIMKTYHCSCNFVPGIYEWLDMQDMACLIADRKLVVIGGAKDTIFPFKGVAAAFKTVKSIYQAAGAEGKCAYKMSSTGHYWNEADVWTAIKEIRG